MTQEIFKKYLNPQRNEVFKKILIQERGCKCEKCQLTEWLGETIHLELHHIDGDRSNCEKTNLQLLCPNCHSYTSNYCSKIKNKKEISDIELIESLKTHTSVRQALLDVGLSDSGMNYNRARQLINENHIAFITPKKENYCINCGKPICLDSIRCSVCEAKHRQTFEISRAELKNRIRTESFVSIGKEYGVSDTAIKKWCIKYGLPSKKKDIKRYSDAEWENI